MHKVIYIISLIMFLIFVPFTFTRALEAGDLVKSPEFSSVYRIEADEKRHAFPTEAIYFSWYKDFSAIKTISLSELQTYSLGKNVTFKAGTLIKIPTVPKVYEIMTTDGRMSWIKTESDFYAKGYTFNMVRDLSEAFFTDYIELSENSVCQDELCFEQKFSRCISDSFYSFLGAFRHVITPTSSGCKILFRYTVNPNPLWVNQEMTCIYNNKQKLLDAERKVLENVDSASCTGPLVKLISPYKVTPCIEPGQGITSSLPICEPRD